MRERFVATLTHDLRTPLTAIKMSAQMLLHRGSDPDVIKKVAPRIVENIDRADRMIRDLLDANRIKAGEHLALDISPCSLPYQIQKTLEELEAVHGPRFEFKTPGDIQGYWSPSAIRRIIENLCSNAVKYGQTNGPVKISLRKNSDHVSIDVCNQGPVITVQDQKTLFAPFKRTNSALSGPAKGWGLGLTLVKGLAEAHGGSVSVKSTKSAGTCFSVNLPLDARPFQKI